MKVLFPEAKSDKLQWQRAVTLLIRKCPYPSLFTLLPLLIINLGIMLLCFNQKDSYATATRAARLRKCIKDHVMNFKCILQLNSPINHFHIRTKYSIKVWQFRRLYSLIRWWLIVVTICRYLLVSRRIKSCTWLNRGWAILFLFRSEMYNFWNFQTISL